MGKKTFWFMGDYRVRSREGIERLVNLVSLSYSAMTLLPYYDELFSGCQDASAKKHGMKSASRTRLA